MAANKNNKALNVPHLRFPEFTEEWKKCSLGEQCSILMCKRILATQTNQESGVPFYKIGTIGNTPNAYISKELFDSYKYKYSFPRKGEIMITCAGTVGKCIVFNGEDSYFQDSNIVWIDNPTEKIQNPFLYYVLSNVNWRKLNSTTITRIYNDDLRNLNIAYPSTTEQTIISSLLSLIDERIATQNKIIEKLETLIKALSATIFNSLQGPVILLSKVASIKKGQQLNGTELEECGRYYVMNGGVVPSGYYNEYNTEANTISISEGGNSCGYVQFNTLPFWSGGHCYTLCDIKNEFINPKYLYHYLKYKEQNIMALRIGSGLPNIQKKALEQFGIKLSDMTMQNRIAIALDTITKKFDVENRIKKSYQAQKSYLLSNLFI